MKALTPILIPVLAGLCAAAEVRVDLSAARNPMDMDRFALGQGGLSHEPIWQDRAVEVRQLHPRVIRLFLQQYFDPMPQPGRYHWTTMDQSVDLIRSTGATPLMCIAFKPKALYPKIDQDIVHPTSYAAWETLIFEMVRHYKQRGSRIRYWEVANEPDIGEDGGCPYRFKPDDYVKYYRSTAAAILRADPDARVGGPALAGVRSNLLPALLDAADKDKAPLHFISWHIYNSDPKRVRGTIDYAKGMLASHPSLHLETFLDEWNMALRNPPLDPRFQPCYIAETAYQMKEGDLDYSCYYHIKDYQVDPESFGKFMSPSGNAMMARWWNRSPQFDGLFDYQNHVRPSFFLFKLLSRLTGNRAPVTGGDDSVHGFATRDEKSRTDNVLVWNFSDRPTHVSLAVDGIVPGSTSVRLILDAAAPSGDENVRLRPLPSEKVGEPSLRQEFELEPWGVTFVWLEHR